MNIGSEQIRVELNVLGEVRKEDCQDVDGESPSAGSDLSGEAVIASPSHELTHQVGVLV